MRRIKGLVAVLLAVCTVFSVTGCDTVERIKERISQETVDEEKVADENKTEVSTDKYLRMSLWFLKQACLNTDKRSLHLFW